MAKAFLRHVLPEGREDLIDRAVSGDLKEKDTGVFDDKPISARYLMQTLGVEWGRQTLHKDLWVKLACHAAGLALQEGKSVVIDDMLVLLPTTHPSEGLLHDKQFDITLENGGTIAELNQVVDGIFEGGFSVDKPFAN